MSESDAQLLAILTGEKEWLTYEGTLTPLFYPADEMRIHYKLRAARELVTRLLCEGIYRDESFSSPISGSVAKIVFKSDGSVEKNGWSITKAAVR